MSVVSAERNPGLDTLRRMDIISDTLCQVVDAAELCRCVHTDAAFVSTAEHVVQAFSEYVAQLNSSTALYDALQRVMTSPDAARFTAEQRRMCNALAHEFERDGIHLSDKGTYTAAVLPAKRRCHRVATLCVADRARVVELAGAVNALSMEFTRNTTRPPSSISVSPAAALRDLPASVFPLLPLQPSNLPAGTAQVSTEPQVVVPM